MNASAPPLTPKSSQEIMIELLQQMDQLRVDIKALGLHPNDMLVEQITQRLHAKLRVDPDFLNGLATAILTRMQESKSAPVQNAQTSKENFVISAVPYRTVRIVLGASFFPEAHFQLEPLFDLQGDALAEAFDIFQNTPKTEDEKLPVPSFEIKQLKLINLENGSVKLLEVPTGDPATFSTSEEDVAHICSVIVTSLYQNQTLSEAINTKGHLFMHFSEEYDADGILPESTHEHQ